MNDRHPGRPRGQAERLHRADQQDKRPIRDVSLLFGVGAPVAGIERTFSVLLTLQTDQPAALFRRRV